VRCSTTGCRPAPRFICESRTEISVETSGRVYYLNWPTSPIIVIIGGNRRAYTLYGVSNLMSAYGGKADNNRQSSLNSL
jgi:hypothetical protein